MIGVSDFLTDEEEMAQDATRASAVNYFYGRISRDEAEAILNKAGCTEGLFLLRENVSCAGNYALSICHRGRFVLAALISISFYQFNA